MPDNWGKLNSGQHYGIIAIDVDRALAHCEMNRYETALVQYVREHAWGTATREKIRGEPWPDHQPCELHVTELAQEWGMHRPRLAEAKIALIRDGILLDVEGRFTINKNLSDCPRLSPRALAYARHGQTSKSRNGNENNGRINKDVSAPADNHKETPVRLSGQISDLVSAPADNSVRPSGQQCPPQRTTIPVPPGPPIEERGRVGREEENTDKQQQPRTLPLADRITRDIFKKVASDGTPDPNVAAMLEQWIGKASERAVIAAAHQAMAEADTNPVGYFKGMCRKGLEEPPADAPASAGSGMSGLPLVTTTQEERDRLAARKFRPRIHLPREAI